MPGVGVSGVNSGGDADPRAGRTTGGRRWSERDDEHDTGVYRRDPDLVSCAQRAATELERAWTDWRNARGRDEDAPAESVASYVAHSIDHPWGRPRVVLGLDAEDARELAALLQQQDEHHHPAALHRG